MRNKALWIFGFLAALGGWGGSPNIDINFSLGFRDLDVKYRSVDYPYAVWNSADSFEAVEIGPAMETAMVVICLLVVALAVALAVAALGLWLITIVGYGGLIGGILKADAGESIHVREIWDAGVRFFPRLLLLRLLAIAVVIVIAVIVVLLMIAAPDASMLIFLCGFGCPPLCCGFILLGFVIAGLFGLMDYAVVVENANAGEAIRRAWAVLRTHTITVLVLWLILFGVSLGAAIGLFAMAVPAWSMLSYGLSGGMEALNGAKALPLLIGLLLMAPTVWAAILIQSILAVWKTAFLALGYRDLAKVTPLIESAFRTDSGRPEQ
ncbi:MAG: hypothetical protein JW929_02600 [Anaerolineales bacterium]|nr:hypothetical protein [Anaerolineales bacterium]